ncbi:MAG TPA: hypothetical protein VLF68_03415 [Candidatus Saccharimonadales bacterium]|nr:hypothetical protein [Candidatus Saccharimonadales bacterium]
MKPIENKQGGQALLILVLVLVVALSVALSLVSRSITNLRTTTEEKESQQALSAAEAGVEQVLAGNGAKNGSFSSNTINFTASQNTTYGTEANGFLLKGGNLVEKDNGADVWLVPYPIGSGPADPHSSWTQTVTFYWGDNSGACNNAAIEVVGVLGPAGSPQTTRYTFDPCRSARSGATAANNFDAPSTCSPNCTINNKSFSYNASVSVSQGLLLRVVPLYANAFIGIKAIRCNGGTCEAFLPPQGTIITSTGTVGASKRKLIVFQGFPQLPIEFFAHSLFSPKN